MNLTISPSRLYQKVELSVTPSEPQYYLFNFPHDVDSVMVHVRSRDKLCMTVSVQAARVRLLNFYTYFHYVVSRGRHFGYR